MTDANDTRPAGGRPPRRRKPPLVPVLLGVWSILLLGAGATWGQADWAPAALGTGLLVAALVGLGFAWNAWLEVVYAAIALTALGLVAGGALVDSAVIVALGVLAFIVTAALAPLALAMRDLTGAASPAQTGAAGHPGEMRDVIHQIHDNTMLSDGAKRVLFRERELGLLRDAIEVDLAEAKYNVALTLCDEMADVFGYREEAEMFRTRILEARQARYDSELDSALEHLDELLAQREWARVHQEVARIRRLFGDSHRVAGLERRVQEARDEHKRELEGLFLAAAQREDVDEAMRLLKKLDRYLDHDEAERLTEVAQGVVHRHKEYLGVQFKMAVNDHRWAEAARIGEALVEEYPNSKMATEVREMLDVLRTRATQAAVAE